MGGGKSVTVSKQAAADSSSSSESSSDEEPEEKGGAAKKKLKKSSSTPQKKKPKSSLNSTGKTAAPKNVKGKVASAAESSSSDGEAENEGPTKKKRKREDDQELETPSNKTKPRTPHTFPKTKRQSSPFRRVRAEEVEVDARVANNSFDAKKGAAGDWGEKANDVLKFTKGKSFRHEKTKKKRGSYCGGAISTQINSIKFESD